MMIKCLKNSAFTLIEMLLALAILGVVAASLFSIFAGGMKISQRSTQGDRLNHEIFWVSRLLSTDVENAVSVKLVDTQGQPKNIFEGTADHLTLALDTENGLKKISYYLNPIEGSGLANLMREEKDIILDEKKSAEPEIIANHLALDGLKFLYGYQEKDKPVEWQTSWKPDGVPAKMKAEIDFVLDPKTLEKKTLTLEIYHPNGTLNE
ncbi:MAG: prepilin-type N-terminal cleavage/methylation domain-containing protein [Candidatus Omnitrophica bacterium]|nr:prepilin-type N-terminal cleavage/methylation domain-containing protein [Candidatus Omnitrophota bacterium]